MAVAVTDGGLEPRRRSYPYTHAQSPTQLHCPVTTLPPSDTLPTGAGPRGLVYEGRDSAGQVRDAQPQV